MSLTSPVLVLGILVLTGCGDEDGAPAEASGFEDRPWVLVAGVDVPQDVGVARPTATFEQGMVAGSTGCNRYTAEYAVEGDSLEIGKIASTRMACRPPADAIERAYVAALAQVRGWRSEGEGLVLVGADDTELLRYAPATPVGNWQVTAFLRGDALASPLAGTALTARFGEDGTLSGSAGCNADTGSYTIDEGAITIAAAAATRKACAEPTGVMEQEAAYLALLPTVARYRVDGRALELRNADGTSVVVCVPAT